MISVKKQWPLLLSCAIVLLTVEQTGMNSGWASPILPRLQSNSSAIPTTSSEGSWMATVMSAVSVLSTPVAAWSIECLGRKISILLTIIPFIVSWIVIGLARTVGVLIVGRAISGVGIAFALMVGPIYLGEVATDDIRGGIGICMNVFVNIGILWMYFFGMHPDLWFSSVFGALPLLFVLFFYKWLPESPYFLVKKNKKDEAVKSLQKLRNADFVDKEMKQIEIIVNENSNTNMFKEFFSHICHWRALGVCLGTITIAQFTGGIALIMYAHLIFQRAGDISMNTLSIIKATLQLITSIGASYVVDSLGKKPLLIISCIGSSIFMACEGIYFYLHDYGYNVDSIWWLPLVAMVMFNICQVIGLTSIPIAYFGELFHPKVKSISACIAKAYMSLAIVIVGKMFQILTDSFGNCVPFFVFAVIGLLGIVFVIFIVPETKGKSLEEIQYYFKYRTFRDNSDDTKL